MKKSISILLSIVMLLCVFSFNLPSFALSYNGFSYEIQNEKVVITGYTGSDKNLTIPAEIDGKSVIKIDYGAFWNCKNLTNITMPCKIKTIYGQSFLGCIALKNINIPDNTPQVKN